MRETSYGHALRIRAAEADLRREGLSRAQAKRAAPARVAETARAEAHAALDRLAALVTFSTISIERRLKRHP